MYKKVIREAFKKAENDIPGRTSETSVSEHIAAILLNDFKTPISGKTLRNLINQSKKTKEDEDISIRTDYILSLCKYLGYNNYDDYLINNTSNHKKSIGMPKELKGYWIIITICVITVVTLFIYNSFNRQKWMIWDDTKFVEVDFDDKKYDLNQLKLFKEEQIENFKRIVPNCETKYFNENGAEVIWYGKNKNGDLEYFTLYGKHPETGKTLKPITEYMIRKYICNSY